jgi:hypothetical protein
MFADGLLLPRMFPQLIMGIHAVIQGRDNLNVGDSFSEPNDPT